MIFPLLLFLILFHSSFQISNHPNQIIFFPNPLSPNSLSLFTKTAEILTNSNQYTCLTILSNVFQDQFSPSSNCSLLIFQASNKDLFQQKLQDAENLFSQPSLHSLPAFRNLYEIVIDGIQNRHFSAQINKPKQSILVCDYSNMFCDLLAKILQVSKVFIFADSATNAFWVDQLEVSLSSVPVINSPYTTKMSFVERIHNVFNYYTLIWTNRYQARMINLLSHNKGLDSSSQADYSTLLFTQEIPELNYAFNVPPNLFSVGCITCQFPNPLPPVVQKFLDKRRRNILIQISKIRGYEKMNAIIEALNKYPEIGFLIKGDVPADVENYINVFQTDNIDSADLLANRKVVGLINDGDFGSIIESIYFRKPMIVLAYDFQTRAYGALVKEKKLGCVIENEEDVTKAQFQKLVGQLLDNYNEYEINLRELSTILKNVNTSRELLQVFQFCDQFGDFGSEMPQTSFEFYNVDFWLYILVILSFLLYNVMSFFKCFACSFRSSDLKCPYYSS